MVSNFGGNVGLFGRMDRLINCFYEARNYQSENRLVGIGALPEGIENNPMLYDLLYALPWTTTDYTRETWLDDYVRMRYGLTPADKAYTSLRSAWARLAEGIYNCPNDQQQGTTESVFLMRPSLTPGTVSSWANSTWYWNFIELRMALREFLSVSKLLKDNDNYRYDLIEVARQALADYGKELLEQIADPPRGGSWAGGESLFLQLILDQDRLLGTRPELRFGRWTEAARALGRSASEKNLYEKNARMLLTTWGDRDQCERGGLHDYANREWQGLLSAYYYLRWKAFFDNDCQPQPWFNAFEWTFVCGQPVFNNVHLLLGQPFELALDGGLRTYGSFTAQPEGDEIAVARELYDKYFTKP